MKEEFLQLISKQKKYLFVGELARARARTVFSTRYDLSPLSYQTVFLDYHTQIYKPRSVITVYLIHK